MHKQRKEEWAKFGISDSQLFKHRKRCKGWYALVWRKYWSCAGEKCWITSWLKISFKDAEIFRGRLLASCFKTRLKKSVRCNQCGLWYKHRVQHSNLANSALYYCPKSWEEFLSCKVQLPFASWTPIWNRGELRWTSFLLIWLELLFPRPSLHMHPVVLVGASQELSLLTKFLPL